MNKKHILLAVDESESSQRAVQYIANLLGGVPEFKVTLYHYISVPDEDFFSSLEEQKQWIAKHKAVSERLLENYRHLLCQGGFPECEVDTNISAGKQLSRSDAILQKKMDLAIETVVVGRHGITREEEFIAGSTSNQLLHEMTKNGALWIVE